MMFVSHEVETIAEMAFFDIALGFGKNRRVSLPSGRGVPAGLGSHSSDPFLASLPQSFQQFVLKGHKKLCGSGIPLTARTTDKLAVNACRLVAFGTKHMEPTQFENHGFGLDVGAAPGHVGRDGDPAFFPGMLHNLGFLFVLFGVDDLMINSRQGQFFAKTLGTIDGSCANQDGSANFV